jgi:hypothetical protein
MKNIDYSKVIDDLTQMRVCEKMNNNPSSLQNIFQELTMELTALRTQLINHPLEPISLDKGSLKNALGELVGNCGFQMGGERINFTDYCLDFLFNRMVYQEQMQSEANQATHNLIDKALRIVSYGQSRGANEEYIDAYLRDKGINLERYEIGFLVFVIDGAMKDRNIQTDPSNKTQYVIEDLNYTKLTNILAGLHIYKKIFNDPGQIHKFEMMMRNCPKYLVGLVNQLMGIGEYYIDNPMEQTPESFSKIISDQATCYQNNPSRQL